MSKESYIRGFCKAAEDNGIDPKRLMKVAQMFRTNGYAPLRARLLGDKLVGYDPGLELYIGGRARRVAPKYETPVSPEHAFLINSSLNLPLAETHPAHATSMLAPAFKNWFNAHKNASRMVNDEVKKLSHEDRLSLGTEKPQIMDRLAKIYHDAMRQSTNSVDRATMPVSKK